MAVMRLGMSNPDNNPWVWFTLVQSNDTPWPAWLWTASSSRWRRVGRDVPDRHGFWTT